MELLCKNCLHHFRTPTLLLDMCERTRHEIGKPDVVTGVQRTRVHGCEDERRIRLFSRKHCGPNAKHFSTKTPEQPA